MTTATGQLLDPGTSPKAAPSRRTGTLRRVMFASQKGGVGKTASAVNVAACLGQMGYSTLIVDTDPIGSIAACFGATLAPGHPGVYALGQWGLADLVLPEVAPGLDLLPYADDGRPVDLAALLTSLHAAGEQAASTYDFMVVDTRPSVADMTRRMCQVVDEVVVVFQCHPLAYRTLGGVLAQLRDARADGACARLLGLLLTMVDATDVRQAQLERHIRQSLGASILPISIPNDPAMKEGLMLDRPVILHDAQAPSSLAYRQLTAWILEARE